MQVTEDHFQKAMQNPVLTTQEKQCQDMSEKQVELEEKTPVLDCHLFTKSSTNNELQSMTPTGFEPVLQG